MFHRERILDTLSALHLLEIRASDPELKEILATFRTGLEGVSTELPWNEDRVPGWFEAEYLGYNISVRKLPFHGGPFYAWHIANQDHRVLYMSDVKKEYETFIDIERDVIQTIDGMERR